MELSDFPLPEYRHLPGKNERPSDGLLESIASQITPSMISSGTNNNEHWRYAVRLFNYGFYWEAHEVLEAFWNCAMPNSRERSLIQCLIQMSNARLKTTLGQPKAAQRLKQLTIECYERAFRHNTEPLMGIQPDELAAAIKLCESATASHFLTVVQKQES